MLPERWLILGSPNKSHQKKKKIEKNTNSEIRKEFLSQNYTRKIKVLVPLAVFRDSDMNFRLKGKELGGKGYVS